MKKIKKICFSIIGLFSITSPVAISVISTNGNQKIIVDGLQFTNIQALNHYLNETYSIKNLASLEKDYFVEKNGKKVYLGNSELNKLTNNAIENSETKTIYTNTNDLKNNLINPKLGELSPKWFSDTEITPGSTIKIWKGDKDISYFDEASALDSFFLGYREVYYFNDIYFSSKNDLRQYLINVYFNDENSQSFSSLRIKAPNGEFSNVIKLGLKSNWKEEATSFVEDNCQRVIKVKTNDGYKYFSANNVNAIKESIEFEDVPYIKVKANDGKMNFVIGLNEGDEYKLYGPNFYTGYSDIALGMSSTSKWTRLLDTYVPNYYNDLVYNFNLIVNTFFENYFDRGTKINTENNEIKYESDYLFSSKGEITNSSSNFSPSQHMLLNLKTELRPNFKAFNSLEWDENKNDVVEKDVIALDSKYYKTLEVVSLTNLTELYINDFSSNYPDLFYIYNEALNVSNNYSSMKNFNYLLKIPLLFSFMMNKLIGASAPSELIESTRQYFSSVCEVYLNVLILTLGERALRPIDKSSSYESLNLKQLFGIYNKEIEFDLTKYEVFIINVYKPLIVSMQAVSSALSVISAGFGIDNKLLNSLAEDSVKTAFPSSSDGYLVESAKQAIEYFVNSRSDIFSNEEILEKVASSDEMYAAFCLVANDALETDVRDRILDNLELYAQELLNSPDSWEFVPNDNVFKKVAFYYKEKNNLEITPNDVILSINTLNIDTMLAWKNAISFVEEELLKEENSNIANVIFEYDPSQTMDLENDAYEEAKDDYYLNITRRKNSYINTNEDIKLNLKSIYSGIYMTFSEFFAVTIMKMLGDLSQKDTLFIMDEEKNAVVINPEYAKAATKIIFDAKENNSKLVIQLTHLYRGFQMIQQKIEELSNLYIYKENQEWELDDFTLDLMLKNTAQYASIINQNLDYLQQQLTNINIPLKTGQIIAYTGTSTELYNERDNTIQYDLNLDTQITPYENGSEITSYEKSFLTKVDKSKLAYVIPNVEVVNNEIFRLSINVNQYLYPTYLINNFSYINRIEYSFEKYLDIDFLSKLNIDREIKYDSLIYKKFRKFNDENVTFENFSEDYTYIKKWGYNIPDRINSNSLSGKFENKIQNTFEFKEIKLPSLTFGFDDNVIDNENKTTSFNGTNGVLDSGKKNFSLFSNGRKNDNKNIDEHSIENISKKSKIEDSNQISTRGNNFTGNHTMEINVNKKVDDRNVFDWYYYYNDSLIVIDIGKGDKKLCFSFEGNTGKMKSFGIYEIININGELLISESQTVPRTFNDEIVFATYGKDGEINSLNRIVDEKGDFYIHRLTKDNLANGDLSLDGLFQNYITERESGMNVDDTKLIKTLNNENVETTRVTNYNKDNFVDKFLNDASTVKGEIFALDNLGNNSFNATQIDGFTFSKIDSSTSMNEYTSKIQRADEDRRVWFGNDDNLSIAQSQSNGDYKFYKSDQQQTNNNYFDYESDNSSDYFRNKVQDSSIKIQHDVEMLLDDVLDRSSETYTRYSSHNSFYDSRKNIEFCDKSIQFSDDFYNLSSENRFKILDVELRPDPVIDEALFIGESFEDYKNKYINGSLSIENIKEYERRIHESNGYPIPKDDYFLLREDDYSINKYSFATENRYRDERKQQMDKIISKFGNEENIKQKFDNYYNPIDKHISAARKREIIMSQENAVIGERFKIGQVDFSKKVIDANKGNKDLVIIKKGSIKNRNIFNSFQVGKSGNNNNSFNRTKRKRISLSLELASNNLNTIDIHQKDPLKRNATVYLANDDYHSLVNKKSNLNSSNHCFLNGEFSTENVKKTNDLFKNNNQAITSISNSNNHNLDPVELASAYTEAEDIISNTTNDKKIKNKINKNKIGKALKIFSKVANLIPYVSFIFVLIQIPFLIIQQVNAGKPRPCAYEFKADNYSWQWTGGLFKNPYGTSLEINSSPVDIRTASEMKLNKPIKINDSYVRDQYYYNGKLYPVNNESREQILHDYIVDITSKNFDNTLYTFNDFSNEIIKSKDNIDDVLEVFPSKEILSNYIISNIEKNPNESKYITDNVKSFTDGYFGNWSSIDSSASINAATLNIINNIRPTLVVNKPILNQNGLLYSSRTTPMLPGKSYDAKNNVVLTEKDKILNDGRFDSNDWFFIDDSANSLNSNNNFTYLPMDAYKKSKENIDKKISLWANDKLDVINTYSYKNIPVTLKFSELRKKINNEMSVVEVLVYTSSNEIKYFVDSYWQNQRSNDTSFENLLAYLRLKYDIKTEVKEEYTTVAYEYRGVYYFNIEDLIEAIGYKIV